MSSPLARYLFPLGVLRETFGDAYSQRAIMLRNIERLRRWMPHYARVHAVLALLCVVGAIAIGDCCGSSVCQACAGLAAALEVVLFVVFACAALALRLPIPHCY